MKIITALKLLEQRVLATGRAREEAAYQLAEKLCHLIYPKYLFSEFGRIWLEDEQFLGRYRRLVGENNVHSADRKFMLAGLLRLVAHLPGDTAECGVYQGASSHFICQAFAHTDKLHRVFDSFEGLSSPQPADGTYWSSGRLASDEQTLRANLSEFPNVRTYRGWIPARFSEVADRQFCFVHIDVDLRDPTHDSLAFFYPRTVAGGILVCDDYGFVTCPGARKAMDDFMAGKPEPIVHCPTGQAFIVKR